MKKEIIDNFDISDIDFNEKEGKHILDSSDKIIQWIKYKINEQEFKENESLPNYRYIDLSNCIISTDSYNGKPSLTNLCDIVEKSESRELSGYFINDNPENNYHQEVQKAFICKNSIIYSPSFHSTKFHEDVDFEGTEFIGNSSFDDGAVRKAKEAHHTIILIDGDKLVDLMYQYNVGIQIKNVH